jgi:hypothetical protein
MTAEGAGAPARVGLAFSGRVLRPCFAIKDAKMPKMKSKSSAKKRF